MKKVITGIVCLLLIGCGDEQGTTVLKGKFLEGTDKSIGTIINNRSICKDTELNKVNELFEYSCNLIGYENIIKEIIVRRSTDIEKENKILIDKYKEDIDVVLYKLEKLLAIEKVFNELERNGFINKYNDLFNNPMLELTKVDPIGTGEYNQPIFDGLDITLAQDRKAVLNEIKGTTIQYGVVDEFQEYVYLLEMGTDRRNEIINEKGMALLDGSNLAKNEIEKIKNETKRKLEELIKFTYTPFIKEFKHEATFSINGDVAKVPYCGLEYTAYDDKKYTASVDGFCVEILYDEDIYKTDMKKLLAIFVNQLLAERNL